MHRTRHYQLAEIVLAGCLLLLTIFLAQGILSSMPARAASYGAGAYGGCAYSSACSISLTTTGTLNISLTPTESSVYSVQKDALTVTTSNPVGYNVTLESGSATSTALASGANELPASSGTPSSPLQLAKNTWGYRLDSQANFGAGPTSSQTNAASSSLSFAGVPPHGASQSIFSSSTNSAADGDPISVWYGVRADASIPAGSYQQTIIYTAVATP